MPGAWQQALIFLLYTGSERVGTGIPSGEWACLVVGGAWCAGGVAASPSIFLIPRSRTSIPSGEWACLVGVGGAWCAGGVAASPSPWP